MRKVILFAAAALLIPSVALAAKPPSHPTKGGKSAPKVQYILKGTLSGYAAYNSSTSTNGTVTIAVKSANYHGKALKGLSLTFAVGAKTKISLENGTSTITDGDKGIVKIKAPKKIAAADLATTLQAATATQIVDQGAPKSS